MKEFDFDELDRAVSSVLGSEEKQPTQTETVRSSAMHASDVHHPVMSTRETTEASAPEEPSAESTNEATPEPDSTETTQSAPAAPALRRSSGRFMDMVHSSSDMRTKSNAPMTRQAPAVIPSAPVEPSVQEETVAPEEIKNEAAGNENDLAFEADDWKKPLESPFLPDAKVEKRPLGTAPEETGFHFEPLPKTPLLEDEEEVMITAGAMPDPIDFHIASEAAKNAAVDEIAEDWKEVDTITEVEATPETATKEASVEEVVATEEPISTEEEAPVKQEAPLSDDEILAKLDEEPHTGPVSITQQYKEAPAKVEESGAIYDTEAYHKPLSAPVKKQAGSPWKIVGIIGLVVLLAAVGAAVYYYALPNLQ